MPRQRRSRETSHAKLLRQKAEGLGDATWKDSGDRVPFEVEASHILWLIRKGFHPQEIATILLRDHKMVVKRERPYEVLSFAGTENRLDYRAPVSEELARRLRARYGQSVLRHVEVVETAKVDDVARRTAEFLRDLLIEYAQPPMPTPIVHIAFAGGWTCHYVVRDFAQLLTRHDPRLPKKLVVHSLVAGFDAAMPETSPVFCHSYFRRPMKSMYLDLSACIGCRACQVACKEWNDLPLEETVQRGSVQNPERLSGTTWKQVKFIERERDGNPVWLFYSDSCKHCIEAPCLDACPTGAIERTADGLVLIQRDVCNGNQHCVSACPFHVIHLDREGVAAKCTFCHDRLGAGLEPACAKVCPTRCIQFGERDELLATAHERLDLLHERGRAEARIYGETEMGGLGVFYLLLDEPRAYGLPDDPLTMRERMAQAMAPTLATAVLLLGVLRATLG